MNIKTVVEVYQSTMNDSYDVIFDIERNVRFAGTKILDFLNLKIEDIIHRPMSNIDFILKKFWKRYVSINNSVFYGNTPTKSFITIIQHNDKLQVIKHTAKAIRFKDKIIGVHIQSEFLSPINNIFMSVIFAITKVCSNSNKISEEIKINLSLKPDRYFDNYSLSTTHKLIVLLLVLGKSDKEIMHFINYLNNTDYSDQAVSKIITRTLFNIFNVTNRSELLKKILTSEVLIDINQIPVMNYHDCVIEIA